MMGITLERTLLYSGVLAALLFFVVPTILIFTRQGFDIERHAISMLSLGEGGWIMKSVFVLSGVLVLASAWGLITQLTGERAGFAGPLLIGAYGAGLILAGIFDAPVGAGFPPGTPLDQEPVMTTGPILHSIAFMIAFGGLIAACFAFAFYFWHAGSPLWMGLSLLTGLALPSLIALGVSMTIAPGIAFYWAAMLGWLWLAMVLLVVRPVA